jgi:hypothetical protein
MTPVRLLVVALLICSLPAIAQNNKFGVNTSGPVDTPPRHFKVDLGTSGYVSTPAEPWRIIPKRQENTASQNPFALTQIDKYKVSPSKANSRTLLLGPQTDPGMVLSNRGGQADGTVTTCLKIRSYVVARDSKDSDSTHPVSYSTCQPSSRYQVRTTEMRSGSDGR